MKTITKTAIVLIILLVSLAVQGQSEKEKAVAKKIELIIKTQKEAMKVEVEAVNVQLDNEELTLEQAKKKKQEIAKKYAKKIQKQVSIVQEQADLKGVKVAVDDVEIILARNKTTRKKVIGLKTDDVRILLGGDTITKYDRRTYSYLTFAVGFNNATHKSDGKSPYKPGGSRFFEMGWNWKTRVFKESNWLRVKYGISLQYNGLKPKDNKYFVENGNLTTLETHPYHLKKSKIRFTNLVVPVFFEVGPSKKIEREHYFRYSTVRKFKFGFGGYAGLRIGTKQKLRYKIEGDRQRDKIKDDYNANDFVYGISSYVSWGSVGLYGKYDLNELFASPNAEQHNFSVGVRFDMN